jgi:hypothetical protein
MDQGGSARRLIIGRLGKIRGCLIKYIFRREIILSFFLFQIFLLSLVSKLEL